MRIDAPTPAGIWPMLYAFFGADGALDRRAMRLQVQVCLSGGASGLAVLGLATEVAKLSEEERRQVVEWAAEDLAGRLPLAVTIFGDTVDHQAEALAHAAAAGAALAFLQPPRLPAMREEAVLARFFAEIMRGSPIPVGIQNAPEYLGVGLGPAAIAALAHDVDAFRVLKGEGPATLIERVVAETGGSLAVFNGRGGLELPDNFRAGCAGLVPAPDCFDVQVRAWAAMREGDEMEAERLYREILPAIVFVMQSIDHLVCYGKRLVAARLGLGPVFDRAPGLAPTAFGEARGGAVRADVGRLRGGRSRSGHDMNRDGDVVVEAENAGRHRDEEAVRSRVARGRPVAEPDAKPPRQQTQFAMRGLADDPAALCVEAAEAEGGETPSSGVLHLHEQRHVVAGAIGAVMALHLAPGIGRGSGLGIGCLSGRHGWRAARGDAEDAPPRPPPHIPPCSKTSVPPRLLRKLVDTRSRGRSASEKARCRFGLVLLRSRTWSRAFCRLLSSRSWQRGCWPRVRAAWDHRVRSPACSLAAVLRRPDLRRPDAGSSVGRNCRYGCRTGRRSSPSG